MNTPAQQKRETPLPDITGPEFQYLFSSRVTLGRTLHFSEPYLYLLTHCRCSIHVAAKKKKSVKLQCKRALNGLKPTTSYNYYYYYILQYKRDQAALFIYIQCTVDGQCSLTSFVFFLCFLLSAFALCDCSCILICMNSIFSPTTSHLGVCTLISRY